MLGGKQGFEQKRLTLPSLGISDLCRIAIIAIASQPPTRTAFRPIALDGEEALTLLGAIIVYGSLWLKIIRHKSTILSTSCLSRIIENSV